MYAPRRSKQGQSFGQERKNVWLVNTGWTGGPYGVGERIKLPYTRAMVSAVLNGELNNVPYRTDPAFGLHVPENCPGVPDEVLDPRKTWSDPTAYDQQAQALVTRFRENFADFSGDMTKKIRDAGP